MANKPMESQEKTKAIFNAGIAKLIRMDRLWSVCHRARINKLYGLWFDALSSIRGEMEYGIDEEDKKTVKEYEKKISEALIDYKNAIENQRRVKYPLYEYLDEYQAYLNKFEHSLGLGMPSKKGAMEGAMEV